MNLSTTVTCLPLATMKLLVIMLVIPLQIKLTKLQKLCRQYCRQNHAEGLVLLCEHFCNHELLQQTATMQMLHCFTEFVELISVLLQLFVSKMIPRRVEIGCKYRAGRRWGLPFSKSFFIHDLATFNRKSNLETL